MLHYSTRCCKFPASLSFRSRHRYLQNFCFCYETTLLSTLQLFCTTDKFTARTRNFSNVLNVTRCFNLLSLHSSTVDPNSLAAFLPPLSFPADCSTPLRPVVPNLPSHRLHPPYLSAHLFTILSSITFSFQLRFACLTSSANLLRPTRFETNLSRESPWLGCTRMAARVLCCRAGPSTVLAVSSMVRIILGHARHTRTHTDLQVGTAASEVRHSRPLSFDHTHSNRETSYRVADKSGQQIYMYSNNIQRLSAQHPLRDVSSGPHPRAHWYMLTHYTCNCAALTMRPCTLQCEFQNPSPNITQCLRHYNYNVILSISPNL